MQAIVYREFGPPDVLHREEIATPVPADNEVLIRVHAASVNPLDWRLMDVRPRLARLAMGPHKIRHPGVDVAGRVEAIGNAVTQFRPGDPVFGTGKGSFAELALGPESSLARKPDAMTFEQAAALPIAGLTALQGLRDKARVHPGQRVLVNGAAGGVGTFAVQIAKSLGAQVTGVCSTRNLELVRSLGADHVIDYTQNDFTRDRQRYDVIFDCVGNHSFGECRRVLDPVGICVGIAPPKGGLFRLIGGMLQALMLSRFVSENFKFFIARANTEDLNTLARLVTSGKVQAIIDHCCSFAEVPEAVRYVEEGHARGKVVVSMI